MAAAYLCLPATHIHAGPSLEISCAAAALPWSLKLLRSSRLPIAISMPLASPAFVPAFNQRRALKITAQAVLASEEQLSQAGKETQSRRRLYVGNIPRTCNNEELAKIFGECGSVEKAEVIYDRYTGKSRRFAFVTMSTVEDAQAAVEKMNGTEIGGRAIKVNVTEKPLGAVDLKGQADNANFVDSPHKVYVGNLAKTVNTETLRKFFAEKGNVLDAKVVRVPETGRSCGYGFVSFSSQSDLEAAIASFNNVELEGKRLRVNAA